MIKKDEFTPDWISPPGDTISDLLEERGWSYTEFAERIGYTKKHITQLLAGKASITEDTARKLELVLGGKIGFWLSREAQYREALLRKESHGSYKVFEEILKELPIKDMIQFGWISKKESISEQVVECLKYFGVSSYDTWDISYKKSILAFRGADKVKQQPGSVAAWLRYGERIAEKKKLPKYNSQLLKKKLTSLKKMTNETDPSVFLPSVKKILEECGVVFVVERTPKGCPVSGLTKWISKDNVLIMQSFRYKSNDHFWFTLFHEIGHVLLHKKKMIYLELDSNISSKEEMEADEFANLLIRPSNSSKRV